MTLDIRQRFYQSTVAKCILDRSRSVLVVGGGIRDREVFESLGFSNVVICNLDTRDVADQFLPFQWRYQDCEHLTYEDSSFDYVVTHAVLHHCYSPHAALLEMYRVATRGALAFESRDGWLMRLLQKWHFTQSYEPTAVRYNDGKFGGVGNSEIPNFIYRWTEREVEKTINSYAPAFHHRFRFFYGNDAPVTPAFERKGGAKQLIVALLGPVYRLFALLFPKQQNLFAFWIEKPTQQDELQPWLKWQNGKPRFDESWALDKYK